MLLVEGEFPGSDFSSFCPKGKRRGYLVMTLMRGERYHAVWNSLTQTDWS